MKKEYHKPIIETEQLFDVVAGDFSLFGRCWGLTSPTPDGSYSHPDGGKCKD